MALNQREKRLLLIPVVLGALVVFYSYVHEPLFVRRGQAAEQKAKVSDELKRSEARLLKEGNLRVRKEAVTAREKVVDAWVPGKNSAALFIWYLSQAEIKSGARIKGISVTEKKVVTAGPQQQKGNPNQQTPPQQGAGQDQGARVASNQPAGSPPAPGANPAAAPAPTLTVVQLELQVDARFAQHLQFNQGLEEMPLFLNTSALSLSKDDKLPLDQVGKLVQSGNTWLAAQVLGASPDLKGSYKVDLYFKADKQGPVTETMHFAESAGRTDPFALDGVGEFLKTIVQFYAAPPGPDGSRGPLPAVPDDLKGQLG